jgi:hypothetical protein
MQKLLATFTPAQLKEMIAKGKKARFNRMDKWDRGRFLIDALDLGYDKKLRSQVSQMLTAHCKIVRVTNGATVGAVEHATGLRLDYLRGASCNAIQDVLKLVNSVAGESMKINLDSTVNNLQNNLNKQAKERSILDAKARLEMMQL